MCKCTESLEKINLFYKSNDLLLDIRVFFQDWIFMFPPHYWLGPKYFTDYFLSVTLLLKIKPKKIWARWWNYSFLTQSKSEVKKESGESSPSEAACLCSPPAAKNQCASCGMEIQDRYLLKVRSNDRQRKSDEYLHSQKSCKRFKLHLSFSFILYFCLYTSDWSRQKYAQNAQMWW